MQFLSNASSQHSHSNNNLLINVLTTSGQMVRPGTGAQQNRGNRLNQMEKSMFQKSYNIMQQENERIIISAGETLKVNPSMNIVEPIQEVTPTKKSGKKLR